MKRNVEVNIKPTPKELAEAWWAMDSEGQVEFFTHLYKIAEGLPFQLQHIVDDDTYNVATKLVMKMFGEYADSDVSYQVEHELGRTI